MARKTSSTKVKGADQASATPISGEKVIACEGLSLTFETADGPVQALSGIDLDIAKGEFVSLIGPSGCGKTTLLRVIADLEQPTDGSVRINSMTPNEARLKRAYGYVFQAPALYPWRTIAKNIALPLEIMGFAKEDRAERVRKGLELVNLTGFENKFSGSPPPRGSVALRSAVIRSGSGGRSGRSCGSWRRCSDPWR